VSRRRGKGKPKSTAKNGCATKTGRWKGVSRREEGKKRGKEARKQGSKEAKRLKKLKKRQKPKSRARNGCGTKANKKVRLSA
jgi:hypothetical protein